MVKDDAAGREAWLRVVQLLRSEENQRRFAGTAEAVGLTRTGLHALMCIHPGEARPMGALAEEWHCDPSNVTSLVDQLEERSLVERRVVAADRRVRTVALTEVGAKTRQRAMDLLSVPPASFATLTAAERRTLRDLLRKVTAHLPPAAIAELDRHATAGS
ncbi:MAG: MarR family winged helix-turn-helix transcriptional regulator [Acidimicrobiales bacterium]